MNVSRLQVRGYLGSNDVNKKIYDTLKKGPKEEFWWLNNGVTIVASEVERKTRYLRLTRPRIVNGLQTSREIFNYARDNNWNVSDDPRHVMVRVLQAADKDLMNHIIKTTNSQTRIRPIYLHATEDIHFNIERAFPAYGLFYERVKNQYFEEVKPEGQIITFPYLMKALMSMSSRAPDQARARPDTFAEREYNKLFRGSYKPEFYAKSALLMRRVENYLTGREPKVDKRDLNNIKYYVAMYACCLLCESSEPTAAKIGQLKIEDIGGGQYKLVDATDELLEESFKPVDKEYRGLIKDKPEGQEEDNDSDQIAKGTILVSNLKTQLTRKFPPVRRQQGNGNKTSAKAR